MPIEARLLGAVGGFFRSDAQPLQHRPSLQHRPDHLGGDWDRLQFLGAELRHPRREASLADAEIQERVAGGLMQRSGLPNDLIRDTFAGPAFENVRAMLSQLPGEVRADSFDLGAASLVRQLGNVVVDALILVAGVGKHGAEGPAQLDSTQVHRSAVLSAGDVYKVLNLSHEPPPVC